MLFTLFSFVGVTGFAAAFLELNNVIEYIPCPRGWYYWGEKCYRVGGREEHERVTWTKAREKCKSYGADLVSIESQEEQNFVLTFLQLNLKHWIWTGLNDRDKEDNYKWSDGTVYNYTNWHPTQGRSTYNKNDEDCVHLWFEPESNLTGTWNDRHCDAPEQFICEMKPDPRPRRRSPNPMYCSSEAGKGWKWEDSCYHIVRETKSWQKAEKYCKDYYEGHLVWILDRLEDLFLDYILANLKEDVWIGIKVKEQWQQKWSSGWYVSFDGFKKDVNFRDRTCVARIKREEWVTIPCTTELPFVCKVSKATPPVLKSPVPGSHCPVEFEGWRDLGGEYCYYFETGTVRTFYEASVECKRRGGNLASLHSKEESDMILPFIKYSRLGRSFYIGFFRLFPREEEFAWVDGSAVDYVNWRTYQPDNEFEGCVELFAYLYETLHKWNDITCNSTRGYICSAKKILPEALVEEDVCENFCIPTNSHLYHLIQQNPDIKKLP